MNGPMSSGSDCVAALQQRRNSWMAAADYRPMKKVLPLAPAGAGKFAEMPDRDDFPEGAEGEPVYSNVFEKFAEENFDGKAVELRTIDQHELKAGFFGAWHGKCVEWHALTSSPAAKAGAC